MTTLQKMRAMVYTIVGAKMMDSSTTLQYLDPYTNAALAEYFIFLKQKFQGKM